MPSPHFTPVLRSVCFLFMIGVSLPASAQMESASNRYFETIGLDRRSVYSINELGLHVVKRATRYVAQQDLEYPQPILLRLRPGAYADFPGDHRIQLGERASVQLDLRWEADMTLERTCYLLSKALLLQYTVFNYGPGRAPSMRAWPIASLATDAYLGLRPAETLRVQQALRREMALDLGSILSLKVADGDAPLASAYWLAQSMRGISRDGQLVRRFFKQALSGIDVAEPLGIQLRKSTPQGPGIQTQVWWAAQKRAILARSLEAFESMAASREWLEALADLSSQKIDSADAPIHLRSLGEHLDSVAVQELVAARYEILRLRLARCNPAYFNAAQSLGTLFETFLRREPSHKQLHALVIYLSDIEDAKAMEAAIGEKLAPD